MGAESSILNDIELDKTGQTVAGHEGCVLHSAKRKDGSRVSVFVYAKSNTNTEFMENAAKQLKVLRHPCIVRFLSWTKSSEGHMLITEPVEPLDIVLERLSVTEICAGIYNIIEALIFLHDRGGLCHNNVSLSSIYVGEDGSWKLGGMEYLCRYEQATAAYLSKCRPHRIEQGIPPEEKSGKLRLTSKEYGHAGDAYAFGILAEYFMELLTDLGDMTKTFELRIQDEFLNEDPKLRPKLNSLLQDRLFKNDYLEIKNFLKYITLKSEAEKKDFFSTVVEKLFGVDSDLVASRLSRPLLSRFVLLDQSANEYLLPHLLTPYKGASRQAYTGGQLNPILSETLFKTYIIPELFKIFHVRDAHIRLSLLSLFSSYAHLFDRTTLASIILPQVLLGVRDSDDRLVESSLHALADLVPLLGGDTVIGPHRGKIFVQSIPKFGSESGEIGNGVHRNIMDLSRKGILKNNKMDQSEVEPEDKRERTLKEIAREADRERRREEARKRREERKKQREEESKRARELAKLTDAENQSPKREVPTAKSDPRTLDPSAEHGAPHVPSGEWEGNQFDDTNTKDDWSDWSGMDDEAETNTDNEIGKEIELELQAMDANYSPAKQNDTQSGASSDGHPHTLPNRTASLPLSSNRALKLKAPKTKSSPPPESRDESIGGKNQLRNEGVNRMSSSHTSTADTGDGWDQGWDAEEESATTEEQTSPSRAPPPVQDNLGAEFDVLTIDVKKVSRSSDFDFFSDMEPVIPKKPSLLETLAEANKQPHSSGTTSTVLNSKLKFAATDASEMESGGWGDDGFDWGDVDLEKAS